MRWIRDEQKRAREVFSSGCCMAINYDYDDIRNLCTHVYTGKQYKYMFFFTKLNVN